MVWEDGRKFWDAGEAISKKIRGRLIGTTSKNLRQPVLAVARIRVLLSEGVISILSNYYPVGNRFFAISLSKRRHF